MSCHKKTSYCFRTLAGLLTVFLLTTLGGCGGGGGAGPSSTVAPAATCDLETQQSWLRSYMLDNYYWSGSAPLPEPQGFASFEAYFSGMLYPGSGAIPKDRWSYITDSAAYNQFYGEGKTLGYGLAVNGLEAVLPLKVRYVEAQSPAAASGLVRGDVILSINGVTDEALIASGDFTALSPAKEGDVVTLQIWAPSGPRTLVLRAATYALTPVPIERILTLQNGAKVGYVVLKDFIAQAESPLRSAFSDFRAAGVTDVILDLRYNGGGRISTAINLASLVVGQAHNGEVFTSLYYNSRQSFRNTSYTMVAAETGFSRVVVLTGQRTCSASELLVNGLKPYLQITTIGSETCGKPFGFNPTQSCNKTISAVNFEVVNAVGEGHYYNGIAAGCQVTDDFTRQLGDPAETLTAAATGYLQTGMCPATASTPGRSQSLSIRRPIFNGSVEPGEYRGMRGD